MYRPITIKVMDIFSKKLSLVIYILNLQFLLQFYRSFVFIVLISGLLLYYEDVGLNNLGFMPLTLLNSISN